MVQWSGLMLAASTQLEGPSALPTGGRSEPMRDSYSATVMEPWKGMALVLMMEQ